MNILPLPVKTEIAVSFKHTFRYDKKLAKDFYDDFMEDVPLLTLEYGLGGIQEMVIFATEEAKHERHYSDEQIAEFKKKPLALIKEWQRYDAYTYDFCEDIVFRTIRERNYIDECVSYVEAHGYDNEYYTPEKYKECKEKLDIMLSDLSKVTAQNYVNMIHDEETTVNELTGFRVKGNSRGQCVDVYFYDTAAWRAFKYINREYIRQVFYEHPLPAVFEMVLGDGTEWSAFLPDYIDDCYLEWNGEVKEDIIAKICKDIVKDSEEELPYSESDRAQLANLARKWLEENLGETLDVD
jgi:hypothetical protein|nr:MAG TPA: hypothetical protein [Caudoviricetes sp.]